MGNGTGTSGEAFLRSGSSGLETLGIDGVGLIGGSIAAAARSCGAARRILGFGRSLSRLEAAQAAGLVDEISTDYRLAAQVDLQICCLPVDRIADAVRQAAAHMVPGAVATDVGSVKGVICSSLGGEPMRGVYFVGSHPLAGSEKQGFEFADPQLFTGRTCVVTPDETSDPAAVQRVTEFWKRIGCRVVSLSPGEHDRVLARTSHMPHAVAACVAAGLHSGDVPYAASGFRDATRIAAGDPALWTAILSANGEAVAAELRSVIDRCRAMARALHVNDVEQIERLLAEGKLARDAVTNFSE